MLFRMGISFALFPFSHALLPPSANVRVAKGKAEVKGKEAQGVRI